MSDEIIHQGPGYTITRSSVPSGLVPYFAADRPDGNVNHGWLDLRGHPEQVGLIAEAQRSPGLSAMLRALANPKSQMMSAACDCALFNFPDEDKKWQAGGYATVMFHDGDRNADANNLVEVAKQILKQLQVDTLHHVGFEFIVEPTKVFFDRTDCHELMLKALGYGNDEATAWAAFEEATRAIAESLVMVAWTPAPGQTFSAPL